MSQPKYHGSVASKKGSLVFSSAGQSGELSGPRMIAVAEALEGLLDLGGREIHWYACEDFRKLGPSDGRVALLNPRMADLPQDAVHLALNVDRKALKASFDALVCAVEIAGRFVAFATGLGDAVQRAALAWVPASAAIATSHPELATRTIARGSAKGQKGDVPFAHAYTATALQQEFSLTAIVAGMALSPDKGMKRIVADFEAMRLTFEAAPLTLPTSPERLAARVREAAAGLAAAPVDLAA
ncbi:hypothetical protein PQI07_27130 [Methylobacterium sp. 092160098-2]|uniref:hypothetical protein n=1 Tax=Methylobacterium sp. 092160098-2 TaxID=3025129 RepID=UPI002381C0E6|nr:hypothetical protein [Methylobacterium sp. 092160098-2]MDE4914348.1 hypothetical protein [Methylobacterium sp. 092160098-2]